MKITIITVCFNSAATISDALHSVDTQTWPDIEHWVIDGASRDETLSLVQTYATPWRHVLSESDLGIFHAMNKGLALATGDVVGFLNSDDVFAHSNVVSIIAETMKDRSIDACYGDLVYVAPNDMTKVVRYWKSQKYRHGLFDRGWVPAHPTFYARRELYEKYGGFDTELRLAADFDILLRFFEAHKITTAYIPSVLVRMRLGGASNSSFKNVLRQNIEIWRAFRKYGLSAGVKPFILKLMSRFSQFLRKPSPP